VCPPRSYVFAGFIRLSTVSYDAYIYIYTAEVITEYNRRGGHKNRRRDDNNIFTVYLTARDNRRLMVTASSSS